MKTILLIEDNQEVRENAAEILELAGYKVLQADNGKTGVEIALHAAPDLIICDIMMPGLDGYGVIHLLSKQEKTAAIPFIFLTAKAERSDFRKGMGAGADDYLTKPFDDVELLQAVETRFKKRESLKAGAPDFAKRLQSGGGNMEQLMELKWLSAEPKTKKYKKREVIYQEGHTPNYLYFLNSGKVKTFKLHDYGKEYINTLVAQNEFFGYVPLLEGMDYTESAECLEDSELTLIPKADFYHLVDSDTEAMKAFIKLLSKDVKEREEQLLKLAYSSVRKRVAEALLLLDERYGKNKPEPFTISMSREDIANIVGTATESLIRTLSDFKQERWIEMKGSSITILNKEKLRKLKG